MRHILIVEDERDVAEMVAFNLRKAGYLASVANAGREALAAVRRARPDLILLDLMLPEISGLELAQRLRADPGTASIPIIMVTARAGESDQLQGLGAGADDYVTKPFSTKVLLARVAAVLRRAGTGAPEPGLLRLGPVEIDVESHEARCDGVAMKLTLTEFRILQSLVQAGGRVLARGELMAKAMGPGISVTERTIDVHVTSIRKKLGAHAGLVMTVRGVGYRIGEDAGLDAARAR